MALLACSLWCGCLICQNSNKAALVNSTMLCRLSSVEDLLPVMSRFGTSAAVRVFRDTGNTEAPPHLILDLNGHAFEPLVGVLLKDGRVMLARVLTALEDQGEKRVELSVCVA